MHIDFFIIDSSIGTVWLLSKVFFVWIMPVEKEEESIISVILSACLYICLPPFCIVCMFMFCNMLF